VLVCSQMLESPPFPRLCIIFGLVHTPQNPTTRIHMAPLARIDEVHAKLLDCFRHFSHSPRECSGNRCAAFAAIHRGQWFDPTFCSWNDDLAARAQRTRKQPFEPFRRKVWQVAGDDQIPLRMRCGQRGGDSCQRPTPGVIRSAMSPRVVLVRNCVKSERSVSAGRSDDCHLGDEKLEQSGRVEQQWDAAEIEECLILTHARTGAPCKNEACDLTISFHGSVQRFYGTARKLHSVPEDRDGDNVEYVPRVLSSFHRLELR